MKDYHYSVTFVLIKSVTELRYEKLYFIIDKIRNTDFPIDETS